MSRHSAQNRRGPDLGLGVLRASCSEPKAPRPLLAPASSKPLCPESGGSVVTGIKKIDQPDDIYGACQL